MLQFQRLYVFTNPYNSNEFLAFQSLMSAVNYLMGVYPQITKEQAIEAVRCVENKYDSWLLF